MITDGSQSYRLAAFVLVPALVLLLGAGGPTLLHLCALGPMPATVQASSEMPDVPPCHGGLSDVGEESGHEAPTAPDGPMMQTCCLSIAAVPSDLALLVAPEQSLAPLVAVLAPFVSTSVQVPAPAPRDTGPPPLPVRSHLALSVLLI